MSIFKGLSDVATKSSGVGSGNSASQPSVVDIGHVLEICLNSKSPLYKSQKDIGKIRYRSSISTYSYKDNDLNLTAYPLDRSIARYPLPGESVILFVARGESESGVNRPITPLIFYTTVISTLHNVSYNGHPSIGAGLDIATNGSEDRLERLILDINLVKTSQNKVKVHKQLQPFEGDFILQGRYGNSVRFGATSIATKAPWTEGKAGVSGDPITILRVDRQTTTQEKDMLVVEDINNDDTSIYLTTSQPVKLNLASSKLLEPWHRTNFNGVSTLRNTTNNPDSAVAVDTLLSVSAQQDGKQNRYVKGSQLLLNSDRIILNAREDYAMVFGAKGVVISSPDEIKIDSDSSVTIGSKGGLHLGSPSELTVKNANKKAPEVDNYAQPTVDSIYEPLVLGQKLHDVVDDLISVLTSAEIVTPVGKASFSQDTLYKLRSIKSRLPEIKSTTVFVDGVNHDKVLDPPSKPTQEDIDSEAIPAQFFRAEQPAVAIGGSIGSGVGIANVSTVNNDLAEGEPDARQEFLVRQALELSFANGETQHKCAKGTYNHAYKYVQLRAGQKPAAGMNLSAGGNANQSGFFEAMSELGYTSQQLTNITKSQLIDLCTKGPVNSSGNRIAWNPGDAITYWSNDGDPNASFRKYGHAQFYIGNISKKASGNRHRWSTDNFENYNGSYMVYGSREATSWNAVVFRAPLT